MEAWRHLTLTEIYVSLKNNKKPPQEMIRFIEQLLEDLKKK